MKKILAAILAAAMALTLSGCAGGDEKSGSDQLSKPNGGTVNTPISGGASGVGVNDPNTPGGNGTDHAQQNTGSGKLTRLAKIGLFRDSESANCTGEGCYNFKRLFEKVDFINLTYIDFALRREVVLCSDSSCKHDSELCNSYFSYNEIFPLTEVFVCGDHLFVLSTETDDDGSMAAGIHHGDGFEPKPETRRPTIFRMDLDGTNREKIYEAALGDIIEGQVFGDGDYLWFVTKTPTVDIYEETGAVYYHSKNRALLKLSVSTGTIAERIPLDDYNNIRLSIDGCAGDKIILSGIAYPNGTSAWDNINILAPSQNFGDNPSDYWEFRKKWEYVVFTLDPDTKELKEVCREMYDDLGNIYFQGDWVYFLIDDKLTRRNLLTHDTNESEDVNTPSEYRFDGFFLDKMTFTRITENWSDDATYLTDIGGTELIKSAYQLGFISDFRVLGVSGDKVVAVYETEKIPSVNNPGAYNIGEQKIGIIMLDDLFGGKNTVEPITPIGQMVSDF
ncbi:MAG: hypothetical protein K2N56_12920 [Oscillospiraceae bacterium]|nr:hypothetical protein [Oscillospiraceae bacterium]